MFLKLPLYNLVFVGSQKILRPDTKTPVTDTPGWFYTELTNELPSVALLNTLSFLRPLKDSPW